MEYEPKWSDTQKIIALSLVWALIVTIFAWMFFPPKGDPGAIAVLNTLVGGLLGAVGMIVAYFFGSSKNSSKKDETIAKLTGSGNGNGSSMAPLAPAKGSSIR